MGGRKLGSKIKADGCLSKYFDVLLLGLVDAQENGRQLLTFSQISAQRADQLAFGIGALLAPEKYPAESS